MRGGALLVDALSAFLGSTAINYTRYHGGVPPPVKKTRAARASPSPVKKRGQWQTNLTSRARDRASPHSVVLSHRHRMVSQREPGPAGPGISYF